MKQIIHPPGMAEAICPFSRAILIDDYLHIAGTTALSHVSGEYHQRTLPQTIEEQTELMLQNIQKCVEAVGGSMPDIIKVVIMLKNPVLAHWTISLDPREAESIRLRTSG
jgi:2-iminobutanoate/2-iminopropanoate deaminase